MYINVEIIHLRSIKSYVSFSITFIKNNFLYIRLFIKHFNIWYTSYGASAIECPRNNVFRIQPILFPFSESAISNYIMIPIDLWLGLDGTCLPSRFSLYLLLLNIGIYYVYLIVYTKSNLFCWSNGWLTDSQMQIDWLTIQNWPTVRIANCKLTNCLTSSSQLAYCLSCSSQAISSPTRNSQTGILESILFYISFF